MHRFTAAQVDEAVQALSEPGRFGRAQEIVAHAAPGLQRVLDDALDEGGWFGAAHQAELSRAALDEDPDERLRRIATLVAEETRLGMLVGVAVGLELAHELRRTQHPQEDPRP